ncbi:MAG: hypothetical protein ACI4RV_02705, partial [Eubacteriales bacterium]
NYSGEETRYADGKVVYEKKDCGLEIWVEYDENGKLEKSHTNNGNTYTYRYFDGDRTPYIYIGNGRWSSDTPEEIHHSGDWTEKDEDGNDYLCFLANYEYIDNGKIVQITQGESITWWEFYDSQGTVLNHPYIWGTVQYDEMQRPISAVNYFTQNDLQYNEDGYLISITSNYFSQVTVYSFEYDENNVLVYSRETCPSYDGVFSDECWYQDGKIIKTKSSNGDTCDETYVSDTDTVLRDENGLIQKVYTHDYNGNNQETTYEYEFDSYDNIKHIIEKESYFDSDGALTEVYITDYYPEYDEFGKIIAETTKKRNWDDVLYNAHRSIRWMFRN